MPHDRRHRDGLLLPGVPFVNIQVRTIDAGLEDLDEDIIDADLRLQDILEPESALRIGFDESLHGWRYIGLTSYILANKKYTARRNGVVRALNS